MIWEVIVVVIFREGTPMCIILYGVYLVFEGLSFRAASRALEAFARRSHVSIWRWVQWLPPLERLFLARRVRCFLVDETMVKVGGVEGWVWVAYEPYQRRFLGLRFSWIRNSMTAEAFLRQMVKRYGRHPVYTDGASWYPEACSSLGLEHRLLNDEYRSLIERAIETVKDRTEAFDDHHPCRRKGCSLNHVKNWLKSFNLHQQPEYQKLIGQIKEAISLK